MSCNQIFGPILIVNIVRGSDHKAYGFVTFQHEESARVALSQQVCQLSVGFGNWIQV